MHLILGRIESTIIRNRGRPSSAFRVKQPELQAVHSSYLVPRLRMRAIGTDFSLVFQFFPVSISLPLDHTLLFIYN